MTTTTTITRQQLETLKLVRERGPLTHADITRLTSRVFNAVRLDVEELRRLGLVLILADDRIHISNRAIQMLRYEREGL